MAIAASGGAFYLSPVSCEVTIVSCFAKEDVSKFRFHFITAEFFVDVQYSFYHKSRKCLNLLARTSRSTLPDLSETAQSRHLRCRVCLRHQQSLIKDEVLAYEKNVEDGLIPSAFEGAVPPCRPSLQVPFRSLAMSFSGAAVASLLVVVIIAHNCFNYCLNSADLRCLESNSSPKQSSLVKTISFTLRRRVARKHVSVFGPPAMRR